MPIRSLIQILDCSDDSVKRLGQILAISKISEFKYSPEWTNAAAQILQENDDRSHVTLVETSRKFNLLEKGLRWSAYVSHGLKPSRFIYSPRSIEIIVNPHPECSISIDLFDIPDAFSLDPISAKSARVSSLGRQVLGPLNYWIPSKIGMAYDIVCCDTELNPWIILTGPSCSQYFHVYHKYDLNYVYSAFSDNRSASLYYLAEILKTFVGRGKIDNQEINQEICANSIEWLLGMPDISGVAKWSVAQAAQKIDQSLAIQALKTLSGERSGIGVRALAELARVGI